MNGLLRMALGLEGVPDLVIADLEKNTPAFTRLLAAAKELGPVIEKLRPLLEQSAPVISKAYPDLVTVLPALEALAQFIEKKLDGPSN